jgi:hypothetical protein
MMYNVIIPWQLGFEAKLLLRSWDGATGLSAKKIGHTVLIFQSIGCVTVCRC